MLSSLLMLPAPCREPLRSVVGIWKGGILLGKELLIIQSTPHPPAHCRRRESLCAINLSQQRGLVANVYLRTPACPVPLTACADPQSHPQSQRSALIHCCG